MYAILICICIKTCGGIWGHNKMAALVKPRRRVSGGYAGEEDGSRVRVSALTASLLDAAATLPQKGCFYVKLQGP